MPAVGDLLTGQIGLPVYEKRDGVIHVQDRVHALHVHCTCTCTVHAPHTHHTRTPRAPRVHRACTPHAAHTHHTHTAHATHVHVQDLHEAPVATWGELERLLLAGDERRHVACTLRNEESSRAHTIFRLSIRSTRNEPDEEAHAGAAGRGGYRATEAELNIVDLAGSERSSPHVTRRTGAPVQRDASGRDVRATEMSSINKSLLVLGTVVQKLAEAAALGGGGGGGGGGAALHVPYRSSKLTRLLQNSLGGEALCTVRILRSMHCMWRCVCAACALRVRCVCAACALRVRCIHPVHTPYSLRMRCP